MEEIAGISHLGLFKLTIEAKNIQFSRQDDKMMTDCLKIGCAGKFSNNGHRQSTSGSRLRGRLGTHPGAM